MQSIPTVLKQIRSQVHRYRQRAARRGLVGTLAPLALIAGTVLLSSLASAEPEHCGTDGVWVEILGSGGPELDDGRASSGYLVWIDGAARLMVDAGPGSALRFEQSGAKFEDLDALVFTHLHVDHSADFPALIKGSFFGERDRPLPVLGPSANELMPSTTAFVEAMIGKQGAYPYLADFLTYRSSGGYKVSARNVPATGRRAWSRFNSANFKLSAIPVEHGPVAAIAWRIDVGDQAIVFSGDMSNRKGTLAELGKGATMLVAHHAVPEGVRGNARELHMPPSQITKAANQMGVSSILLSHRMNRTKGRERQTLDMMEADFDGRVILTDDGDCWGL